MNNRRSASSLFAFLLLVTSPAAPGPSADAVEPEPFRHATGPEDSESIRHLECTDRIEGLFGDRGSAYRYSIDVPPGARLLVVGMEGGTGDADMYLRHETPPTLETFDFRPYIRGNEEEIRIPHPAAGTWHLMIHADDAYENVRIHTRCYRGPEDEPEETRFPFDLELAMYYELSGTAHREEYWSSELRNQALHLEGRSTFNVGDYNSAIDAWRRWAELDPDNPDPVSLMGDVYLSRGELDIAIEHYRKSLDIHPGRILLMLRLARLLDTEAHRPEEARDLLNHYSRVFPNHPDVALARAEWLIRRKRHDEADSVIQKVIAEAPDYLRGRALLHGLLHSPGERLANMRAMREVAEQPGMERVLGQAVQDHQLLTRPESWVLMDFIEHMSLAAPDEDVRNVFFRLLPRDRVAREDLRLGRLSRNWISSRDEMWNEEGGIVLSADPSQTEAYLRLDQSDALHNGFIEADIDHTRGFFWMYARRGQGNMIRFGFDDNGLMFQQVWINGQLRTNESRLWSKPPGEVTLRLEVRGDGAFTYVDGQPAFGAPLPIPGDMGLGWWGVAPWAPEQGKAAATLLRIEGGPAPVKIALLDATASPGQAADHLDRFSSLIPTLSVVAPARYRQRRDGRIIRSETEEQNELRLLSRYYRVRFLPLLHIQNLTTLDWESLIERAERDRLSGFTLQVAKMPDPAWFAEVETRLVDTPFSLVLLVIEPSGRRALLREIRSGVGLFPGARRSRRIPIHTLGEERPPSHELHEEEGILLNFSSTPEAS